MRILILGLNFFWERDRATKIKWLIKQSNVLFQLSFWLFFDIFWYNLTPPFTLKYEKAFAVYLASQILNRTITETYKTSRACISIAQSAIAPKKNLF